MSYQMSQRSSPFRRPASPGSPTAYRGNTPPSTSRHQASPLSSPSKLKHSYTVSEEEEDESLIVTPTKTAPQGFRAQTEPPPSPSFSPTRRQLPTRPDSFSQQQRPAYNQTASPACVPSGGMANDNLARLPPPLLHSLRESFSVLDSSSSGTIDPSSVRETLQSLGLSTNDMAQLFPPGQAQQITLPQYLNSMANVLVNMSSQQELANAFSAFDEDDSGQIDVAELKRALMSTPPEPGEPALSERDIDEALRGYTGRRTLGRNVLGMPGVNRKGGDVFRYHEFMSNLSGSANQEQSRIAAAR